MRVLRFLRGGINQTRICRCVLRLEFLHGLEVRGVSDNFGKLFQLLELIQFGSSLFVFSNSSAHNKFSFWTWSKTYASIKRSTTTKSRLSFRAKSRMERLGKPRHRRKGQKAERAGNERIKSRNESLGSSRGILRLPQEDSGYAETAGRGSAVRFEPSGALTKLFPSSDIGPGNLRHSVS